VSSLGNKKEIAKSMFYYVSAAMQYTYECCIKDRTLASAHVKVVCCKDG